MIFIAGRLWDHFLMILEVVKKRERRKKERQDRWRKIQEYEQSYFGSSNKSRRSAILKENNHGNKGH